MAEVLRELVVALSLDSDNFARNLRTINLQIREAESTFRLAGAGVTNFDKTVAGTQAQLSLLGNKLTQQNRAVEQYSRALIAANQKLTDSYNRQERMKQSLATTRGELERARQSVNTARASYERYASTLGESDSATIAAKRNLELAQQEYQDLADKVKLLEGQLQANSKTMQNNADAVSRAQTNLNNAQAALRETEAEIRRLTEELHRQQSAWTVAGEALIAFSEKCDGISRAMITAGRGLTRMVTAPIAALGATAVKSSISFESAFTSVRKTVDATEEEFAVLSDSIKEMSTEVATSADDIAEVTAVAGQLGIANAHLMEFTRTMIDLGTSTDIVADEAASTLAKFANITNMDQSLFGNLGAALVDLGNNYATTESAIMEMALRLAAAGHQVGLSEAQILGFATALSAVGIEAQMGGSAFSKALVKMEVAAATGGAALDDFAAISGMTADQFRVLFEMDPAAAFQSFIVGLAQMDEAGMSAIATLQEIGIVEVRLRDTLLRATNANELFAKTQVTANAAWGENAALLVESGKRYATTESRLINLKNTALLFAQQIGDDLNPTIQALIDKGNELLSSFLEMDASQRMAIIKFAAFAAAAGPAILVLGKALSIVGKVAGALGKAGVAMGKFSAQVSMAGGGVGGFVKTLGKSKLAMVALAAAVVYGAITLYDYASGAKEAQEALEGMNATAESWKNNAANTFYSTSEGLSFFGMSGEDFAREIQSAEDWKNGMIAVWSDGEKETDEIVAQWTESFKALTAATRTELEQMQADASSSGYTSVAEQIGADIKTLDAMDEEIGQLLSRRRNGILTEAEQIRLDELIDTRHAIEVKYKLSSADAEGFDTIRKKVEAEIARAQARGQTTAEVAVFENAMVASAEGMAALNSQIDAQYDKEYELIQLIEDAAERQTAMEELNAWYNDERRNAALEYAQTMAGIVLPVWRQEDIQKAASDVDALFARLRQYSTASTSEKPAILTELETLTANMDESAMTEYIALLTQIQSLMDSGLSEAEVQSMFPELDFSTALEQLASIQLFLSNRDSTLSGLDSMFGEALPEEVLTIATELDMTGAQTRWNEFAMNPGAITTDAVIEGYREAENVLVVQPSVEAFIDKYTEVAEGASTASLTPAGVIAYVSAYAEATGGADVSGLTPQNVTAMVSAYRELSGGADVSTLTPNDITAYIGAYLESAGVDTTGLTPEGITAFVLAYEEATGGALTTSLAPDDITAMVARYLEAEGVDVTALSPDQINAIVSAYAEATSCDKSALLTSFTAYITAYDDSAAVKPTLSVTVGISGYDLIAYRNFLDQHPVEVKGIVRLGELYAHPDDALQDPRASFWQEGIEIPVTAVPQELLTPDKLAVLAEDGTMHVFITPEITGSPEAIDEARAAMDTLYTYSDSVFGKKETSEGSPLSFLAVDTFDLIKTQTRNLQNMLANDNTWGDLWGLLDNQQLSTMEKRLAADFDPARIGEVTAYVSELATAIRNGDQLAETDLAQLQSIVDFMSALQLTDTGENIRAGIAEGMTAAGWAADAETLAAELETALNTALGIQSPSTRMKPVGSNVTAGIAGGMSEFDLSAAAASVGMRLLLLMARFLPANAFYALGNLLAAGLAQGMSAYSMIGTATLVADSVKATINTNLNSLSLRPAGLNAMAGLRAGILAGRYGVISAMRAAARAAVNAAKAELKIHSPSDVFRDEVGVMTMRGFGEGVLQESREQAHIIRNASRYLTGEAKEGAVTYSSSDNRRTYDQSSSVNLSGNTFYVRDEQDIHSLAIEIAGLTRRQQRGKGLRMA